MWISFGLQDFKSIMLKYRSASQHNFFKTAAMLLGPQSQRGAVISVWQHALRQLQYQHTWGRPAWPKTVMFNTQAQTIPRNERRIVKDSCTSTGGSPRNVAKKDGKAEHFF